MPKENKKRGRRGEAKRREDAGDEEDSRTKRRKIGDEELIPDHDRHDEQRDGDDLTSMPFYGMLTPEEQEYFRSADEMLEMNQFADAEERSLFLKNVYREADGKELKLACSQSCSRLLERLIMLSETSQLTHIYSRCFGHIRHLVQHRFASHCCETLFLKSAQLLDQTHLDTVKGPNDHDSKQELESSILKTVMELEPDLGFFITDAHGSHALRVLLVVLSGQPLDTTSTSSVLRSKRKENVAMRGKLVKPPETNLDSRAVPLSFRLAANKILARISSTSDTTSLRALATHPTGNPVLQLLLEIEFKDRKTTKAQALGPTLGKLIPDGHIGEGSESLAFINGLLYDPIGSRLLEVIIKEAPGKVFKEIYKGVFKDNIGKLASNEVAGYVVNKILERLGKENLAEAVSSIIPHLPTLVARSRTSIIKTILERCLSRELDTERIVQGIREAYGEDPGSMLMQMLSWPRSPADAEPREKDSGPAHSDNPGRWHGSILAQFMLTVPGLASETIRDGLLGVPIDTLLLMAEQPAASHLLQVALTAPSGPRKFHRKLINRLSGHLERLALQPSGGYVVDALWTGTQGLGNYRERVAEELMGSAAALKESYVGRAVWRNWKMDLYQRQKTTWLRMAKAGNDVAQPNAHDSGSERPARSGIELARQRFAANRASGFSTNSLERKGTGRGFAAGGNKDSVTSI